MRLCRQVLRYSEWRYDMKTLKYGSLAVVLFLIMGISIDLVCSDMAAAAKQPVLTVEDCVKCHAGPPADIAAAGGKHRGVGCFGCHAGHPPMVEKPIPKCSQCHMGKSHFEIKGCLGCHKNPHTPLNITFAGNITDVCLNCHMRQITELRKNKSKHTLLNCSRCHSAHRKAPQCTQCHKPHSAEMAAADCGNCHKAHMPKVVTYAAAVPSKDCGSCHKRPFEILSAGATRHRTLTCAFCHKERHKTIPQCLDCHGSPHRKVGIMMKFAKCSECHNTAHDLNNWPAEDRQAFGETPRKKK